jgi:hypothetical protein
MITNEVNYSGDFYIIIVATTNQSRLVQYSAAGTCLILDFNNSSACPPVDGVGEISVTYGVVVLEFIAAVLGVED